MSNLLKFLMKQEDLKAKVHIDLDDKKEECIVDVEGDLPSILTGLSVLAGNLVEQGMPKDLLLGAIIIGVEESKSKKKRKTKVIKIDDDEKAKNIEELLNKLVGEDE